MLLEFSLADTPLVCVLPHGGRGDGGKDAQKAQARGGYEIDAALETAGRGLAWHDPSFLLDRHLQQPIPRSGDLKHPQPAATLRDGPPMGPPRTYGSGRRRSRTRPTDFDGWL